MKPEIKDLLEISDFFGSDKNFVIAGGGNTSFKDENTIWIKASGQPLAGLTEEGLVALDRKRLQEISGKKYSDDPVVREDQVKTDLYKSIIDPSQNKRPSVETSLHELIDYKYVVHLHPTLVNGILCSHGAKTCVLTMFNENDTIFVPYTDPGYILYKKLEEDIQKFRRKYCEDPAIILLENHGVFVGGDTIDQIKHIYKFIIDTVSKKLTPVSENDDLPYNIVLTKVLPVIRMMLSEEKTKVIRYRHNALIAKYYKSQQDFNKIALPLTPDAIVYCKTRYMYIEQSATPEKILDSFRHQLPRFINEYGFKPRVIVIKDMGVFAVEDSYASAETVLDIFEDSIKVCHYSLQCSGTKVLSPEQVSFIDKWEVENYRRKASKATGSDNKLSNKIAIVTGGAQGFGAGIAESLYRKNINVVIADLNETTGNVFVSELGKTKSPNKALFVKTDVSDPLSVKNLVTSAVKEFGGLDIMVSNAGILRAGGLDEMEPDVFSKMTQINYNGYYNCAKYASEVMKLQNQENPEYFTDIIQINSKSGLRGSNRNFAYAGAKFGGIGLTQSFALELAPDKIKVNSICPGNFYEGPLWSDPQNGLFVQYLKTGKVPGAKTIDDVRQFYENQAPLKRGCRLEDVVKALLYIIDQEYETGQAIPVTGGQVMLS